MLNGLFGFETFETVEAAAADVELFDSSDSTHATSGISNTQGGENGNWSAQTLPNNLSIKTKSQIGIKRTKIHQKGLIQQGVILCSGSMA